MRLYSSLTEEFTSPLPPAELLRRVRDSVQQRRDFTGRVGTTGFAVEQIINYRNSFLPRIEGWVAVGLAGGSRLRLRHRLSPFVLVFGVLWLGVVGSVAAAMGLDLVQGNFRTNLGEFGWPALIPVGMLLVGLLLFTVPFWAEVRQSRPLLVAQLQLQATPEPAAGR
ncbi:hypothetical protein [Hymenobacter psoromatis]|uniref:hypothetical protein n=1 Tax=Hymenobacter psoromatis TaxID=1484116 RepID=UPI001CBFBE2F|nr:hypothetical protein [Hymenobacter psoromatis]